MQHLLQGGLWWTPVHGAGQRPCPCPEGGLWWTPRPRRWVSAPAPAPRAACGGPPFTALVSAPAPALRVACGGPPIHGAGQRPCPCPFRFPTPHFYEKPGLSGQGPRGCHIQTGTLPTLCPVSPTLWMPLPLLWPPRHSSLPTPGILLLSCASSSPLFCLLFLSLFSLMFFCKLIYLF